jgi:hypothetical protein
MKKVGLLGGALAVITIALGTLVMATSAGAQEGVDGRRGMAERVAEKLGIEVDALKDAVKQARLDRVDEALANGRITEEQAANARTRIEEGRRAHPRIALRIRHAIVESSAAAIGIEPQALRDELRAGKSIADVATDNGVSIDDVKARILADAQSKLAIAVENGRIAQERADAALAKLEERLDQIVTHTRPAQP